MIGSMNYQAWISTLDQAFHIAKNYPNPFVEIDVHVIWKLSADDNFRGCNKEWKFNLVFCNFYLTHISPIIIKKYPNTNARQIQGIRLRWRASRRAKINTFLCLLSKETQYRQSQCNRKYEVTVLSNVIIHESEVFYLHRQQQQRRFNHDAKCVNRTHDLDNNMTYYHCHLTSR